MMLKVIIADDEERVCRLVKALVEWEALDMEVIGTAANGFEALDLIKRLTPDILVTDIRMPGCNGLELIERAKQALPELEIVLISGYAQFEYAQIAMRYDVGGYLLKPIKKEALTATLEKLAKRCREREASVFTIESLRKESDRSHNLLRNRLPEDLFNMRIEAPLKKHLFEEYGFEYGENLLRVFILKLDYDLDKIQKESIPAIQSKAEEILASILLSICPVYVFRFCDSYGLGILSHKPEERDKVRKSLRQCLNQLEAQRFIFGSIEFSLALSEETDNSEKLPFLVNEAKEMIAERLVEGSGHFIECRVIPSLINIRELTDKFSGMISHISNTLSEEEADNAAGLLEYEVGQASDIRGFELLDLVLSAGRIFALRLDIKEEPELLKEFELRCGLCSSSERLFCCLRDFQKKHIRAIRDRHENEAARPIRIAKQYIHRHFKEPITLEDVCAATGFSISYFSTIFKKSTGEGFSKYLTRVRMERAKELLRETRLPVTTICEEVGYNDLKHFTGTFKKATSLNPGQYRKLYG